MNDQTLTATAPAAPKVGHFRRGLLFTQSSWRVLKLDKELAVIPMFSFLAAMFVMGIVGAAAIIYGVRSGAFEAGGSAHLEAWQTLIAAFVLGLILTTISNFFSAAVVYGATQRFRGENPSVKSSLAGAWRKFRPLAFFSLMMASVGFVLQLIEERVPFAGRIAVWLVGAAWNIANFFAIPIIVLSDKDVPPLEATKQSVAVIKKVWGEGMVAQLGIGLIGILTFIGLFVGLLALGALGVGFSLTAFYYLPLGILGFLGFLVLTFIFGALGAIAKAAVFYYAQTGESPEMFNKELLRAAMTPRKARKLFARV